MSAFGRRSGGGSGSGTRPSFGVARPMQGGGSGAIEGGAQFPPLDSVPLPGGEGAPLHGDAMARLTSRQDASGD